MISSGYDSGETTHASGIPPGDCAIAPREYGNIGMLFEMRLYCVPRDGDNPPRRKAARHPRTPQSAADRGLDICPTRPKEGGKGAMYGAYIWFTARAAPGVPTHLEIRQVNWESPRRITPMQFY